MRTTSSFGGLFFWQRKGYCDHTGTWWCKCEFTSTHTMKVENGEVMGDNPIPSISDLPRPLFSLETRQVVRAEDQDEARRSSSEAEMKASSSTPGAHTSHISTSSLFLPFQRQQSVIILSTALLVESDGSREALRLVEDTPKTAIPREALACTATLRARQKTAKELLSTVLPELAAAQQNQEELNEESSFSFNTSKLQVHHSDFTAAIARSNAKIEMQDKMVEAQRDFDHIIALDTTDHQPLAVKRQTFRHFNTRCTIQIVLALDFEGIVGDEEHFKDGLIADLVAASCGAQHDVEVKSLRAGSVIADVTISGVFDGCKPLDTVRVLQAQVGQPDSKLMQGTCTRTIVSLNIIVEQLECDVLAWHGANIWLEQQQNTEGAFADSSTSSSSESAKESKQDEAEVKEHKHLLHHIREDSHVQHQPLTDSGYMDLHNNVLCFAKQPANVSQPSSIGNSQTG